MDHSKSRAYRFWDAVEVRLEGCSQQIDPLARCLGPFRVEEVSNPGLVVRCVERLDRRDRILLPEQRGFFNPAGLGWEGDDGRGIFLSWPEAASRQWTLQSSLAEMKFPQFRHFLDLRALEEGIAAIHGSAVQWEGKGIIAAGPPHSGKTALLTGFLNRGGQLIGDDWLWTARRQGRSAVLALNQTIEISPEQFRSLTLNRRTPSAALRSRFRRSRLLKSLLLKGSRLTRFVSPFVAGKIVNFAQRKTKLNVPVQQFRQEQHPQQINPSGLSACFLIVQSGEDKISCEQTSPVEMARRLSIVNRLERSWIHEVCYYAALAFSLPRENLSSHDRVEREILSEVLEEIDCYLITYPSEVDPERLHRVAVKCLQSETSDTQQQDPPRVNHG